MIYVYIGCLAYLIVLYLWLMAADVRKSIFQNITLLIVILSCFGFIALIRSKSLSEALLAIKITYLAGCFLPLTYLFTICEVCNKKINKFFAVLSFSAQGAIFGCACGIGFNDYFYKSVSLSTDSYGNSYLIKEYGPFHFLYPLSMGIYLFIGLVIVINTASSYAKVYKKHLYTLIYCAFGAVFSYVIQRLFQFSCDIIPISFAILITGVLIPIYYSNIYSAVTNKKIVDEQLGKLGFITFDRKLCFRSANDYAYRKIKDLKNVQIGSMVEEVSPVLAELMCMVAKFDVEYNKKTSKEKKSHKHSDKFSIKIGNSDFDVIVHTVDNYMSRCVGYTLELRDETEHYQAISLKNTYNLELAKKVAEKTIHIREMQDKSLLAMAQMVESRDLSTGGHIRRTSDVVKIFSKKILGKIDDIDRRFLKMVTRSAPMHDLGKIAVDDAILRKQAKFTDEEYEVMKTHAKNGAEIVRKVLTDIEDEEFVKVAENVAHYHHEKVDGTGYPEGLKGEEIPIEARIMALADVFDALVSKRCYKEAFSYDKAFSIIENDAGKHFDAKLAEIFLTCRPELEEYYDNYKDE